MNFMEEINKETQAMLKQISIRKAEKKAVAEKRIAELKKPLKKFLNTKNKQKQENALIASIINHLGNYEPPCK